MGPQVEVTKVKTTTIFDVVLTFGKDFFLPSEMMAKFKDGKLPPWELFDFLNFTGWNSDGHAKGVQILSFKNEIEDKAVYFYPESEKSLSGGEKPEVIGIFIARYFSDEELKTLVNTRGQNPASNWLGYCLSTDGVTYSEKGNYFDLSVINTRANINNLGIGLAIYIKD